MDARGVTVMTVQPARDVCEALNQAEYICTVSYTHLTLPTKRIV